MKRAFPVLMLLVGLGSFISCKHPIPATTQKTTKATAVLPKPLRRIGNPSTNPNPFDRYLANTKANWPEQALTRFAGECRINTDAVSPKYAQSPEQKWIPAHDLSNALKDQETDFYGTLAVWHYEDRFLIELWGMELDTGDYYRLLYCADKKVITLVGSVSWEISTQGDSTEDTGWGYEHKWKLASSGKFETVSTRFIDLKEQPMRLQSLMRKQSKD